MDLALQIPSFKIHYCANVLILIVISTTTAQFQQNSQNVHQYFQQPNPQNSEHFYQFPHQAQTPLINYTPIHHHPQQLPSSQTQIHNEVANSQPQTIVPHPQWNRNPDGQFYSLSNEAFHYWNQQQQEQQQHPTPEEMSQAGYASPNSFRERYGIFQPHHPYEMHVQQHPQVHFQQPMEESLESATFLRRTQNSKNPHLAKLKILAARQERMRRVYRARLRNFYRQQQLEHQRQQRLLHHHQFSHRGTYGVGPELPQQALANPGHDFGMNGGRPDPMSMAQAQAFRLSQELQRARAYRVYQNQMQNYYQHNLLQAQPQQQQQRSYPASIQEILQQQSPAAPVPHNDNQNTLEGQQPSPQEQQPSLNPAHPTQQDYSTVIPEQNLPPLTHFHPQPTIRWRQKGRRQRWPPRLRKIPPRPYPVGHSNGYPTQHHRAMAIRQSSLSLASAGVGTVFSSLWEVMETLIGSISLFLYVIYSAVTVPLG